MPSINTYIAEIKFESGGDARTAILAESQGDAVKLLEFLCGDAANGVRVLERLATYSTEVKITPRRSVTAYIQAASELDAERLFEAMYGEENIGRVS